MSDAVVVAVAKELTEFLGAATLSQAFTPQRSYGDWELPLEDDSDTLHVDVVSHRTNQKVSAETRGKLVFGTDQDIAIRKKFRTGDEADDGTIRIEELDALMLLVQEIHELCTMQRLTEFQSAKWEKTELVVAPLHQHLHELRQFTGIIRLTFRADRVIGS